MQSIDFIVLMSNVYQVNIIGYCFGKLCMADGPILLLKSSSGIQISLSDQNLEVICWKPEYPIQNPNYAVVLR